jgi:hypothetical protein
MENITWKSSKKETIANSENEVDVSLEVNPGLLARRKFFSMEKALQKCWALCI